MNEYQNLSILTWLSREITYFQRKWKSINVLQSSLYESQSSTPILHLTLTGTSQLEAMADIASPTNCITLKKKQN